MNKCFFPLINERIDEMSLNSNISNNQTYSYDYIVKFLKFK